MDHQKKRNPLCKKQNLKKLPLSIRYMESYYIGGYSSKIHIQLKTVSVKYYQTTEVTVSRFYKHFSRILEI